MTVGGPFDNTSCMDNCFMSAASRAQCRDGQLTNMQMAWPSSFVIATQDSESVAVLLACSGTCAETFEQEALKITRDLGPYYRSSRQENS
jgi:hypothetical protein